MKKIVLIVIAIILVATLGWWFWGKGKEPVKEEPVKIGAILPLTGKAADAGNAVKVGLDLAVNELNSKSQSSKYEVYYFDTESDVKKASFGYKRLKEVDKANVFFTTTSDHSLLLKPLSLKDSLLLFCIAPHPDITKDNFGLVFRPAPSGNGESEAIFNHIEKKLNAHNIFVYSFNTDAGNTFKSLMEGKFKTEMVGSCLFDEDPAQVKNITSLPAIKKAECIVVYGYSAMIGHIIKSLRERGYAGAIICNSGFNTPSVLSVVGDNATNVLYVDYDFPYTTTEHMKRDSIAKNNYKTSFSALSYMAYCPVYLIDKAINDNCKSEKEIGMYLSKEKEYDINGAFFNTHSDGSIIPLFVITILR